MNETNFSVTRTRLENLSTGELISMAEDAGIDIPPGLDRMFIIEELLLEQSGINKDRQTNELEIINSYTDSVALPKQYNISFIEVMIRDPLWVYIYWEIKRHDRELYENSGNFDSYFIRIYPLNEGEVIPTSPVSRENSFTIAINTNDLGRYVGFTEDYMLESRRYIIKLGVIHNGTEHQIAISQPFMLPEISHEISYGIVNNTLNPLIRLSGAFDFSTTKSMDRQFRVKG